MVRAISAGRAVDRLAGNAGYLDDLRHAADFQSQIGGKAPVGAEGESGAAGFFEALELRFDAVVAGPEVGDDHSPSASVTALRVALVPSSMTVTVTPGKRPF